MARTDLEKLNDHVVDSLGIVLGPDGTVISWHGCAANGRFGAEVALFQLEFEQFERLLVGLDLTTEEGVEYLLKLVKCIRQAEVSSRARLERSSKRPSDSCAV